MEVTIDTADGPMRLYEARPDGEIRGGIVVVQEAFGVNDHIEDVTRRAAAAGYHAVAPDVFHRSGPGSVAEYGDWDKVMAYFGKVGERRRRPERRRRRARPPPRRRAHRRPDRPGRVLLRRPGVVPRRAAPEARRRGRVLRRRHRDRTVPAVPAADRRSRRHSRRRGSACSATRTVRSRSTTSRQLRTALRDVTVDTEIVRYADAGHGFHCDIRDDYRADDAKDAWARALAWFDKHLA